jgi:hypothetical protein
MPKVSLQDRRARPKGVQRLSSLSRESLAGESKGAGIGPPVDRFGSAILGCWPTTARFPLGTLGPRSNLASTGFASEADGGFDARGTPSDHSSDHALGSEGITGCHQGVTSAIKFAISRAP